MIKFPVKSRTLIVSGVIMPLLALFIYVGLRSGPLAPIAVTLTTVESRIVTPALFGIGTVEARHTYKIGPIFTGRIKNLVVDVGDHVKAGQLLGEMEPIDLEEKVHAEQATFKRSQATLNEAQARKNYAQTQVSRYEKLFAARLTSEENVTTKQQELHIAQAVLSAAKEELTRVRANWDGLRIQRNSLRLIAPIGGIVIERNADSGTTIVAGQSVIDIIDPQNLWVNVRFDQINANGLAAKLPAQIMLRSRNGEILNGEVLRVELKADAITEEILAKVVFDTPPKSLPPLGELAEVTVDLTALPATPTIPNAAIRHKDGKLGVWQVIADDLHFTPITLGETDLNGFVQVRKGLNIGDNVVVYSEKSLTLRSSIHVVTHISGTAQ